jgi:hypothetical protein
MLLRFAIMGIITLLVVASASSARDAGHPDSQTATTPKVTDGSHDFDFLYGKWRMPNHRLKQRLAGSQEWADFVTCDEAAPLPGGIGNTDFWRASYWKDFVGVTVRTYDRESGLWRIYWVDNTFSKGIIDKPVVGKFQGNVGIFEGEDTYNGRPVLVRFIWTVNPAPRQTAWEKSLNPQDARVVAKWEQAFSVDGGKSWETNWYNEFIRDDHCAPSA